MGTLVEDVVQMAGFTISNQQFGTLLFSYVECDNIQLLSRISNRDVV